MNFQLVSGRKGRLIWPHLLFAGNSDRRSDRVYYRRIDMQFRYDFFNGFYFWCGFFFRPSAQGEGPLT